MLSALSGGPQLLETTLPSMPPSPIMAECKREEPGATSKIHFNVHVHGSGDLANGCGLVFSILLTDMIPEDKTVHEARQRREGRVFESLETPQWAVKW